MDMISLAILKIMLKAFNLWRSCYCESSIGSQPQTTSKAGDSELTFFSSSSGPKSVGGKASLQPKKTPISNEEIEAILVDVLLCADCFHNGSFVSGHSSVDFVRVDSARDYGELDGESWSDQETLLLLEAMEIHKDNWNEIAEYVGTKSKAQCILYFLRLPTEDGMLENINVPSMSKPSNLPNGDDNGDSENRLPFGDSGNPVMSLVAFLASAVGPRVAAACAHASLAAMSGDALVEGSGPDNRTNLENLHGRDGGFHGSVQQNDENSAIHGSLGQKEADAAPLSTEKVEAAAKAGLSAAAMKAKLFADHEEREIQRLSANIVNHQLKRFELKLKQFAEVETFLMKECEQVEKTRQRFAAERARMLSTRFGTCIDSKFS